MGIVADATPDSGWLRIRGYPFAVYGISDLNGFIPAKGAVNHNCITNSSADYGRSNERAINHDTHLSIVMTLEMLRRNPRGGLLEPFSRFRSCVHLQPN